MTCIVGIAHAGNVWIGADSAGVTGYLAVPRSDPKVFRRGPFLFGFTSSFRMGQLLEHKLQVKACDEGRETFDYMVTDFVDAVRTCLKDGGFASRKDETETGGTFLVGYRGRLFQVGCDYQVGETTYGFDACGCGQELALGSLHTTAQELVPAQKRVLRALEASAEFCTGVRAPFTILDLNRTAS